MTGVGGAVRQVARDTGEALGDITKNVGGDVVKSLKSLLGGDQKGEQGIEGVGSSQQTGASGQRGVKKQQDLVRKSQEEEIKRQKGLKHHRDFLERYKQEQTEYWQEQEAEKRKKKEEEKVEEQEKIVQLQEDKQKRESISVQRAKTSTEIKRGAG